MEKNKIYTDSNEVLELHSKGIKFICPKCKNELIVILEKEEMKKFGKSYGIYCPINEKHVFVKFIMAEDRNIWQTIDEELKNTTGKDGKP